MDGGDTMVEPAAADHGASGHLFPRARRYIGQVRVGGPNSASMQDRDGESPGDRPCKRDDPRTDGPHRSPGIGGQIDPPMARVLPLRREPPHDFASYRENGAGAQE